MGELGIVGPPQLNIPTNTTLKNIIQISAGYQTSAVLSNSLQVLVFGSNSVIFF